MRVLDSVTLITDHQIRSRIDQVTPDLSQQLPVCLVIINFGFLLPGFLVGQLSVQLIPHHQNSASVSPLRDESSSLVQVLVGVIQGVNWKLPSSKLDISPLI